MSNLLTAVKRASVRRATATAQYHQAVLDARAAGHTMPEIGAAAGITKQGVRSLLLTHGKGKS